MTKLDNRKLAFICKQVVDGKEWTVGQLAAQYGVTKRRVRQVAQVYRETGRIPVLNPLRRPKSAPLTSDEKRLIDRVWEETKAGSRMLFKELRRRGYKIPLHKIHRYQTQTGRSMPNLRKQKKRKRCRYEREHSFSLVHGDWHRTTENSPHAIVWLDDASRCILAYGEFSEATAENSINTFKQAQNAAKLYNSQIREVNTDRGPQFYSNHPNSISQFEQYLIGQGIGFIPSRRSNPQTNGKVERFWLEYDRHRWRFTTIDDFIAWYNNRIHGALWLDIGERPSEAIVRKLQPESLLGFFMGWCDGKSE